MSSYRCLGCREYHTRPEHRRIGLGSVCSDKCAKAARKSAPSKPAPPGATPATIKAVRARDKDRCRFCGRTDGLHAHHIRYRSEGTDNSATNLITLCSEHHALVHSNKRRWQPVCLSYVSDVARGRYRFLPEIDCEINGEPAS